MLHLGEFTCSHISRTIAQNFKSLEFSRWACISLIFTSEDLKVGYKTIAIHRKKKQESHIHPIFELMKAAYEKSSFIITRCKMNCKLIN